MMLRYAIYLAPPPDSALWRFGARALGRDAATDEDVLGFAPAGHTPEAWRAMTAAPRRYGFHATLKAPFRLREGRTPKELEAATAALAAETRAFEAGELQVAAIGFGGARFAALTPKRAPAELAALEARALRELDLFRAPPTEAEIARRVPERLSPRQRELLAAWGYPYVLDQFRLHFTLSGPLESAEATTSALGEAFAQAAEPAFRVDALCLFGEDERGVFTLLRRFVFAAAI